MQGEVPQRILEHSSAQHKILIARGGVRYSERVAGQAPSASPSAPACTQSRLALTRPTHTDQERKPAVGQTETTLTITTRPR
jgi:hypothetical protein